MTAVLLGILAAHDLALTLIAARLARNGVLTLRRPVQRPPQTPKGDQ